MDNTFRGVSLIAERAERLDELDDDEYLTVDEVAEDLDIDHLGV